MGKKADLVVLVDRPDNKDNIGAARFLYGCQARSCLVKVSSLDQMVKQLRTYESIGRLVFLMEGFAGHILLDGIDVRLGVVADQLHGTKMTVSESIVFDGCNIAEAPLEMLPLLTVLRAPKAIGFVGFHFVQHTDVKVTRGDSADGLRQKLAKAGDYVIPNQPGPDELVKTPGSKQIFMEYWSQTGSLEDKRMLIKLLAGTIAKDRLHFPSRADLQRKTFNGAELPNTFDTRGPVREITVVASPP